MVLLAFAAGGSSSERKRSRPIRAFSATPHDGQRRCRTLLKIPTESSPELRISPALQLKREWSPWPEFGSDPGNPREFGWCRPRRQAPPPRSWPTPELRIRRVGEDVCHPHPPQTRTCRIPASGSSQESLANGDIA